MSRTNDDLLGIEVHGVGDELAGRGGGVVVAVGQRTAALEGVGLLGQQPGLVEGLGGRADVAQAAVEQDVVDALAHEGVELDHHRADRFLVALEDVDGAGPLLAGGLEPLALGAFGDDALLGLDRGDHLAPGCGGRAASDRLPARWSPSGRGSGSGATHSRRPRAGPVLRSSLAAWSRCSTSFVNCCRARLSAASVCSMVARVSGGAAGWSSGAAADLLVIGGPSRGDPDDRAGGALALLEPPRRGLVVRVELEGLLEERLCRRGRALREGLTAQFGELRRQRRLGRVRPGCRPGQDEAEQNTGGSGPP